ncbi:MAG: AMP-binding protein [Agitococcus sp.]|nr:AMP-binding protein [Agitococcus sp.]
MTNAEKKTLLHCLLYWEKTTPSGVYLTQPYGDGVVKNFTWQQVGDEVRRVATYIQSLNLPPKSNIALLGRNSAHWIMADLAIWMAGHVTVPMYPTLNGETAAYIFDHSDAKALIVGKMDGKADGWKEIKDVIPASLPIIATPLSPAMLADKPQWTDIVAKSEPMKNPTMPDLDDISTIVYTSGSTGQPKGVLHSFRTMIVITSGMEEIWGFSNQDRMLSYLPLAHVAERAAVETMSLYFGFHVFFSEGLETFQKDLQRAQPTIFFSVPRLWTKFFLGVSEKMPMKKQKLLFSLPILGKIVKKKILSQLGMDKVRTALTGSAPLPPHIIEWYRNLGLELLDVYGMSENFAYSHACKPNEVRVGYVGSVNPGCEHRIADNGEIQVKSPAQMIGYFKMPDKMAEEMTDDGYFKTGDRGEIDEKGRLRITGRVKELFKTSKGKYVAPAPIENKLNNHPKIEVVCATGSGEPQPFALLMLSLDAMKEIQRGELDKETLAAEFKELLKSVNETLEDHERMDYVVVVKDQWTMENGFLTPTMKIKRNIIEDRYLANAEKWLGMKQRVIWE